MGQRRGRRSAPRAGVPLAGVPRAGVPLAGVPLAGACGKHREPSFDSLGGERLPEALEDLRGRGDQRGHLVRQTPVDSIILASWAPATVSLSRTTR